MSFLKIENINKSYGNEEILNNINLEFDIGEFVCILGPSGCGKSTLLNLIGLIDEPSNGFVYLNNRKIANRERQKYRYSYYGYIYQNYNLLEYMDVEENIKLSRLFNESNPKEITKVLESLEIEGYKNTNINLLSGGEKQRVDIARCLYKNPKIILADEPTGSLDESLADNIMSTLKNNSSNHLIIMVTHNEELALKYATRIIRLYNHGIIEDTKLIETELIDHSENNRPYKSIGLFKHIKNTLKSYKNRPKVSLTLIAVFTLVFLLIQGIDSITNGFNYYNSYLINNRLDRDYINVEYLLEGYSIETILKTNKIEYKKESNYDFICNYYLKEYIAITNNIDFDFEVSCIDFELINTEKIDQNSYLIVNSLFKNKYEDNNIQFSYNSTILGKIVSFNKDYYIDYIYNEGSIFNNPKIYINTKVIEELLSTEIIDYIYNEQDLYTIPERYFIISGYSTLYKLLSSYEGCSNYLNNIISSKTEFVYENSTDILRSTFSSLIDSASKILYLVMILVCFGVIKLTSLTLEYSIKSRNKELGLYLSFGLKNKDLLNIILSENIILLIPSLGISFGLSYILSFLINSDSKTLLKQNFSFDIYKINNLGFFISVMLLLLILMIASSSSYSKLKKFEIKEVLAYE